MKQIPLTQGYKATVDDEDYPVLSKFKWQVYRGKSTNYAKTSFRVGKKSSSRFMHNILIKNKHGMVVHHKDGNGLNNCKSNIEATTQKNNIRYGRVNKSVNVQCDMCRKDFHPVDACTIIYSLSNCGDGAILCNECSDKIKRIINSKWAPS